MEKTKKSDIPARVLSAAYIERHKNKKDLVRRLRAVVESLSDEDVEAHSSDFPGLDGLAALLIEDRFLNHRDKEVRLHAVLACMEMFAVYAPDPPWDEKEILQIFTQLIRQLANLSHCTSPAQANYDHYFALLQQLSVVKIGVVVVEMTRTLDSGTSPSHNSDEPTREEAIEVLGDLIRTILHCVHIDHPAEVTNHAVYAISACIEDFDGTVPTAVLDELLIAISTGPTVFVTNPAAVEAAAKSAAAKKRGLKMEEKMPPMQIQQTNPSYMVAASVIRRTVDRVSTHIAGYLNSILNGDPAVLAQTNISSEEVAAPASSAGPFSAPEKQATADIWAIIYELHRISPQILTTVIGTVTNSLLSPTLQKRLRVTKLLGRLFYAPSSQIGVQFSPCFRQWLGRCKDKDSKVRMAMAKCLVMVLAQKGNEPTLAKEAAAALVDLMENDPNLDVRLLAVHQVCDLAFQPKGENSWVPARLLQAVGSRVSSKNKIERRDALTGLAQIYNKYYVHEKLKQVQIGGDDCDIDIILDVLRDTCHPARFGVRGSAKKRRSHGDDENENMSSGDDDAKYSWIPRMAFESVSYSDDKDTAMRNRVVQIVDDVLLGATSDKGHDNKKTLTPTSRAVGLAFIIDSLRDETSDRGAASNAYKWMCSLFAQRAELQRSVGSYIDTRAKLRECESGTEDALKLEAEALAKLEKIASLSAPISASASGSPGDNRPILEKFHGARDKHIFRILATISSPTHSASARARAFDELPKRTKSLGEQTSTWVKMLARRCAMGNFLNVEVVNHCILLAQECFHAGDMDGCLSFLSCVKMTSEIFPAVCANKEGFGNLIELFSECQRSVSGKKRKSDEKNEIITLLSSVLAAAAPARSEKSTKGSIDDVKAQLLDLCTRDGTPEQARHAVYTMAALIDPASRTASGPSLSPEQQGEAFGQLLRALTSSSRMNLMSGDHENAKIVGVLTALAALSESAPALFSEDGSKVGSRGDKAVKFALETCLLGRRSSSHEDSGVESDEDDETNETSQELDEFDETPESKSQRRKSRKSKGPSDHLSPAGATSAVEDGTLSLACRRACAAIEFLVARTRHGIMNKHPPSDTHIEQLFDVLSQIVRDGGLPPSSRDRRLCKARQDRAALRQCAATHLLRLCDGRLKLEEKYLDSSMWHKLGGICLDEEKTVREAVMGELSMMMRGQGKYGGETGGGTAAPPSLRFVALVTLCTDGDHVAAAHSSANGNAANVGKRAHATKDAAAFCVTNLRKAQDTAVAQCRLMGRQAEQLFETQLKPKIMPEYCVPFALNLLAYRRETPYAGGSIGSGLTQAGPSQDGSEVSNEESQHKVLRKRLKWLFEPLVLSLGDGADNISFLLRMAELLGTHYRPSSQVSSLQEDLPESPGALSLRSEESQDNIVDARAIAIAAAKLKTICAAAREVLLSFVKKDADLTPYPGGILVPQSLFVRSHSSASKSLSQASLSSARASLSSTGSRSSISAHRESTGILRKRQVPYRDSLSSVESRTSATGTGPRESQGAGSSGNRSVHFSPNVRTAQINRDGSIERNALTGSSLKDHGDHFGAGVSPIHVAQSPVQPARGRRSPATTPASEMAETKTMGSTPPSNVRTQVNDQGSTDDEMRLSAQSPKSESSRRTRPRLLHRSEDELSLSLSLSESPKRTRSRRMQDLGDEEDKSDESLTTSETQGADEDGEPEPTPPKKRKVSKKAASPAAEKPRAKPKKKSSDMGRVKIEMGTLKSRKSTSKRTGGRKSKEDNFDEFDFDEGNQKENSKAERGSKASKKAPAKKSRSAAKHSIPDKETVEATKDARRSRRRA